MRAYFTKYWQRLLAGIGGIVAIGLSWGMEVRSRGQDDGLPEVVLEQRIDVGPYAITLHGAELHDTYPGGMTVSPGNGALWINATVENLTPATRRDVLDYVKLGRDADIKLEGTYLRRDMALNQQLQPGLPEEMILVTESPRLDQVRVTLMNAIFKKRDALSGASNWFIRGQPKGTAVLKVAEVEGDGS